MLSRQLNPIQTGLYVTYVDVSKNIKNLPSNKAPRYDKVTARVLKDSSPVTVPIIQ